MDQQEEEQEWTCQKQGFYLDSKIQSNQKQRCSSKTMQSSLTISMSSSFEISCYLVETSHVPSSSRTIDRTTDRGVNRGGIGGLEPPPLCREKNWDIIEGKIVIFHKNTKFGALLCGVLFPKFGAFFEKFYRFSRIWYKIPKFGMS